MAGYATSTPRRDGWRDVEVEGVDAAAAQVQELVEWIERALRPSQPSGERIVDDAHDDGRLRILPAATRWSVYRCRPVPTHSI